MRNVDKLNLSFIVAKVQWTHRNNNSI